MSAELKIVETPEQESAPAAYIAVMQPNDLNGWLHCEPYLKRALEHTDEWALEDVCGQYIQAKVFLIGCFVPTSPKAFGALCVEIINYPKKKVFQIHLFGADDHTEELWMDFIWPQVQKLASELGCAAIMGTGRDGWARKLQAKFRRLWEVPV